MNRRLCRGLMPAGLRPAGEEGQEEEECVCGCVVAAAAGTRKGRLTAVA
jgi:hypothetical protein